MKEFVRVKYDDLNGKQKEQFNFQKLAATLAEYGFNCIKLMDDWLGADFLAYHVNKADTLRIQLKSRITVQQKYSGKEIWMAFPFKGNWYLLPHDILIEKVKANTKWLDSDSWIKGHGFSSKAINAKLLESLQENNIGPVFGAVIDSPEA
jgi:hypothetical protein